MTGFAAIFDLPVLLYVTLWALAAASTITVVQRIWMVRGRPSREPAP